MPNSRQFQISPFQSDLLDLFRWIAAFLVVIEHVRSLMFVSAESGGAAHLIAKPFYFITGFGHSAVMIFFVMSGFLVGGKVLERLALGTFAWMKYVVDRSSRLYAVYVLALILGAVLDYAGCRFFNAYGLYDRSFSGTVSVVNHDFHQNLTAPIFAVNLAMCQTILGPVFGSNGPLWSLANEFWYYLAGPLLFALFFTRAWWRRVAGVGVLVAVLWFLPAHIQIYFLVWLLGAGLYFLNSRPRVPLWFALPLFLVCFSAARLHLLKQAWLGDFLIAPSFALVINAAACSERRLPARALSRKAADFSYSVYLCHFPFLVFGLSAVYQTAGIGLRSVPSVGLLGLFLATLFLIYLWCYGVSLITERQTPRIREGLHRFLGRGRMLKAGVLASAPADER